MSINNYNSLSGGIRKVNPIEIMSDSNTINVINFDKTKRIHEEPMLTKGNAKYISMENFMRPALSNLNSIEGIKRKIKTGKITFHNTFDDEEDDPKYIKVITMAPGFVYGVDTRKYYPKKNVPVGPSISDMS